MKYILLSLGLLFFNHLRSQDFSVKVDFSIDNNELVADFMVTRHTTTPFAFRSSNFSIYLNPNALNIPGRHLDHTFDGPWDDNSNPTNYYDVSLGNGIDYITCNINSIVSSPGSGTEVPMVWTRIARARIPITDPTQCTSYTWRLSPMSVRDWGGTNLKPLGNWINGSYCIPLCNQPITPVITSSSTRICPNQSVTLNSGQMGFHEWTLNGQPLTDTTATLQAFLPGTYQVKYSVNGCFSVPDELILEASPDTILNTSVSDTFICSGSTYMGNVNPNFITYTWLHNGNIISDSASFVYSQPGKYYVNALNSDNCIISDSVEIFLYPAFANLASQLPDSVCGNSILNLNISNSVSGNWNIIQGHGQIDSISMPHTQYFISPLDTLLQFSWVENGYCSDTTLYDTVIIKTILPKPDIQISGNQLVINNYTLGQWYKDGILLPDSTQNTITPSTSGNYSFLIQGICNSVFSDTLAFIITSQDFFIEKNIKIYPNPSQEKVVIEGIDEETELKLSDINGKIITQQSIYKDFMLNKINMGIVSGSYILELKSKNRYVSKLIIWY